MFCPYCGKEIEDDEGSMVYCTHCSKLVKNEAVKKLKEHKKKENKVPVTESYPDKKPKQKQTEHRQETPSGSPPQKTSPKPQMMKLLSIGVAVIIMMVSGMVVFMQRSSSSSKGKISSGDRSTKLLLLRLKGIKLKDGSTIKGMSVYLRYYIEHKTYMNANKRLVRKTIGNGLAQYNKTDLSSYSKRKKMAKKILAFLHQRLDKDYFSSLSIYSPIYEKSADDADDKSGGKDDGEGEM